MGEKKGISRKQFIRLGAGAGATAAALLGGCGDQSSATRGASGGVTIDGMRVATGIEPPVGVGGVIARESEVAFNSAVRLVDAETEQPAILIRFAGEEFVAYSALCSHEGCPVFYQPESQRIACPCHGVVFDPARGGAAEVGPAQIPLEEIRIEVRDGDVARL